MEKKEALRRWQNLTPDQHILPHSTPIAAYAHIGSTADGEVLWDDEGVQ